MNKWIGFLPSVLAIGLAGGIAGFALIENIEFAAATFVVATIAGAASIRAFGRKGRHGWAWALFGAIIATAGSAFAFGLLLKPSEAYTLIFIIFGTLLSVPFAGISWVTLMGFSHIWARHWRRTRNSSFPNG